MAIKGVSPTYEKSSSMNHFNLENKVKGRDASNQDYDFFLAACLLESNVYIEDIYTPLTNVGPYRYTKDPIRSPVAHAYSFSQRHIVDLFAQCSPIISLKLSILYTFLTPILMQPADLIL